MSGGGTILARAVSDAQDRLLSAEEPLAGLQRRCGGELPGTIATPELLALVRRARRHGLSLAHNVTAQDNGEIISAWIEVEPVSAADGCEIRLRSWQSTAMPSDDGAAAEGRRRAIDRHLAELSAQLDAGQRVLAVVCDAPDLQEAARALEAAIGQRWTDVLMPENVAHQQPLHWRLLDGIGVVVPGSPRRWRAALVPRVRPGFEPAGFELLLLSDEPFAAEVAPRPLPTPASQRSLVGDDLAPALRQPIARIIANAETIRTRLAGPLPDAYAEYAGEIAGAGNLLLGLLEDMADLEVVESEGFAVTPDHIDLSEVARQAAGILNVRAQEKGITVQTPPSDSILPALAEFRRVLQIALNLISNAIRYGPAHSRIEIRVEDRGEVARLIVADQGSGLSANEQARVFNKFERLGRSGDGGSGLGLYISRSLARAMGGDLTVESAPGQGARFMLDLPADRDSPADRGSKV
ncbi:two-component signal transduction histidine kinase [Novosphingobium sp. Rr 2-17]|uniref:sensor histidine kinase n=1 Tax=Novosphingobium sp. Rr 2-17 TaxID=555793 RepID=UPI0002699E8A|nr:HAMP domain-containing sensor histidine kinase [Novosphingobium sp. Rr 2-17]EIZ80282.1 two-component signal transduction histidine kinase [Novosphingobium sp. Rr 2-17]